MCVRTLDVCDGSRIAERNESVTKSIHCAIFELLHQAQKHNKSMTQQCLNAAQHYI